MPVSEFGTLRRQINDIYGEEALGESVAETLGDTLEIARQFQEGALQGFENLMAQAQRSLATLTARRAKLMERLTAGRDWADMEDIRERLGEQADEFSDQLAEMGEALVGWLENQRLELEEKNLARLADNPAWRGFLRWMDEQLEKAQDLSDALLEQFDEEAATISAS